jgi:hypothetical protein
VRSGGDLAAGNLAGNFRKRIHKGMNLLVFFLEFDASSGQSFQMLIEHF